MSRFFKILGSGWNFWKNRVVLHIFSQKNWADWYMNGSLFLEKLVFVWAYFQIPWRYTHPVQNQTWVYRPGEPWIMLAGKMLEGDSIPSSLIQPSHRLLWEPEDRFLTLFLLCSEIEVNKNKKKKYLRNTMVIILLICMIYTFSNNWKRIPFHKNCKKKKKKM